MAGRPAAVVSSRGSSGRSRLVSDMLHLAQGHPEGAAGQRRGHVLRHRRGDQHLLAVGDQLGQPVAPPVSSSANTSSRISTGSSPPSCRSSSYAASRSAERERPGLAVAGVALGRQRAERSAPGRRGAGRRGTPRARAPGCRTSSSAASSRSCSSASPAPRPRRRSAADRLAQRGVVGRPGVALAGADLRRTPCPGSGARSRSSRKPGVEQLGADPGQVAVPDLEGVQGVARASSTGSSAGLVPTAAQHRRGRLQQRVALLEHPVVVRPHPGPAGLPRDQQVVQEPAPLAGVALDQGQVLGREQHRAQRAEHVARPRHRRRGSAGPGWPCPALISSSTSVVALVLHDRAADDRRVGARTAPAARRWPPGGCPASRGSRPPRPGWSCPARWARSAR